MSFYLNQKESTCVAQMLVELIVTVVVEVLVRESIAFVFLDIFINNFLTFWLKFSRKMIVQKLFPKSVRSPRGSVGLLRKVAVHLHDGLSQFFSLEKDNMLTASTTIFLWSGSLDCLMLRINRSMICSY